MATNKECLLLRRAKESKTLFSLVILKMKHFFTLHILYFSLALLHFFSIINKGAFAADTTCNYLILLGVKSTSAERRKKMQKKKERIKSLLHWETDLVECIWITIFTRKKKLNRMDGRISHRNTEFPCFALLVKWIFVAKKLHALRIIRCNTNGQH